MDDDWGYPHDLGNPQMNIPMITGRKSSFSWFEVPPKIKSTGKVKEEPRDIFMSFQPLWKILVNRKDYPAYYGK